MKYKTWWYERKELMENDFTKRVKKREKIYIYLTADTVQISVEAFNEAMQREIAMVSVVKRLCIAYLSTLMDSGGCRNFLQH